MRIRWILPVILLALVLGLLFTPLNNANGQSCGTITAVALDPNYRDGEDGGYPDDSTSCHRAAQPRGILAVLVMAGGLGAWAVRRRADQPPAS